MRLSARFLPTTGFGLITCQGQPGIPADCPATEPYTVSHIIGQLHRRQGLMDLGRGLRPIENGVALKLKHMW